MSFHSRAAYRVISGGLACLVFGLLCSPPRLAAGMWMPTAVAAAPDNVATARPTAELGAVLRTLQVGLVPFTLAVDEADNHVFVLNGGLYATRGPVPTPTPGSPQGVPAAALGSVTMLDALSGAVLATTTVGVNPQALVVDARTRRVFVVNSNVPPDALGSSTVRGSLSILDARSGALLQTAPLGYSPVEVAVDSRRDHLFVLTLQGNRPLRFDAVGDSTAVSMLDARTGALLHTVYVGKGLHAPLGVDEQTDRVFVPDFGVLDARTGAVMRVLPHVLGSQVVVDEAHGQVFYADPGTSVAGLIHVLDATTGAVLRTMRVAPIYNTSTLMALDPLTAHLFVAHAGGHVVSMVDIRTGAVVRTITVGATPWVIAADPLRHLAFVAKVGASGGNSVTVVETRTGAVLRTVGVGSYPGAVAVAERAGHVFVANKGLLGQGSTITGTISVLDAGPVPAPNPADPVAGAGGGARYFPQTQHTLGGAFLAFWQRYGGLDTFGYPRTEPFTEAGHLAQYTDRFELEVSRDTVVPAPLGRLLTAGRTFPPVAPFASTADRRYIASTRHSLAGRFLAFWRTHRGDVLLGPPIAEVTHETNNDGSGRTYLVQWFENGRLESHPELKGTRYEVQLGLVGKQALQQRGWLP